MALDGSMEYITQDQILALGLVGLVVGVIAGVVCLAMMAGSLKLSISWFGNRSPSFVECIGWLLGISFVNCFLIYGTLVLFGEVASLIVTPLTWFLTLYMVSMAADCGLFRAFGIWFANSILSTLGLLAVIFVAVIPLAILGAGADSDWGGEQAEVEGLGEGDLTATFDAELGTSDAADLQDATPVNFQTEQASTSTEPAESSTREPSATATPTAATAEQGSEKPKPSAFRSWTKSRQAADGSTINPYFQD